MSHIIRDKEDILIVKDTFDLLRRGNVSVGLMEEILKNLLPKDNSGELLVGYQICEKGNGIPFFSAKEICIHLSIEEMCQWVERNINLFIENIDDFKIDAILKDYIFLFVVVHEIEHSYQYLMAKRIVDAPCNLVADGYDILYRFITEDNLVKGEKIKNLISLFLYYRNKGRYVIERNANVESLKLMRLLSMLCGHDEIAKIFHERLCQQLAFGYCKNSNGSFEESFRGILMLSEYKALEHNYDLPEMERIRYGLPISKETRKKMLVRK